MEDGRPSRTAENTAVMRALHQALPPHQRIFNDPIATRLVTPESEVYRSRVSMIANLSASVWSRFTHYILRSRYAEDCLAQAVQQCGILQYVILGAGLDTFAYRQPGWASSIRIFEVDHPATQQWKRDRLKDRGIVPPENVTFAPIDFDRSTIGDGLANAGFRSEDRTFLSMLGVSQYLTEAALERCFEYVVSLPRFSEIVLTINPPEQMLCADDAAFFGELTRRFAAIGEPWLTRPVPEQFISRLYAMGFTFADHLTPAEANARYFKDRPDDLRASEAELMVRAVV